MSNTYVTRSALEPLDPAIKLLMKFEGLNGSNNFIDDVGHTVVLAGTPTLQTSVVLDGTSSGYFNGTTDNLAVVGNDFEFTGDFTIEFQFQLIGGLGSSRFLLGNYESGSAGHWMFTIIDASYPTWYINGAGNVYAQNRVSLALGVKYKMVLMRKNGVCTMTMNGVAIGSPINYAGTFGRSDLPVNIAKGGVFARANMYFDDLQIRNFARY